MPELDGLEATRRIRGTLAGPAAAHRGHDGQRDGGRPRGMPRGRHERLHLEADSPGGAPGRAGTKPVDERLADRRVTRVIDEHVLEELRASVGGGRRLRPRPGRYVRGRQRRAGLAASRPPWPPAMPRHSCARRTRSSPAARRSAPWSCRRPRRTLEMAGRAGDLSDGLSTQRAATDVRGEWEAATAALKAWVTRSASA